MSKKEFGIKLGDQSKILNKEEWSRHGIIYSTTTTNLNLYLTYIQEQLLNQKSGFIYINCVPDMERRIQMKEVCKSIGKENDFYTLDFNIKNESNSINIFNENKDIVNDFINGIFYKEEINEWQQKSIRLISSLTNLLMCLKEQNLVFPHNEIKNIHNIKDLKKNKNKYEMGFYIIDSYLNTSNLLDLIKLFEKIKLTKIKKSYLDLILVLSKITNSTKKEILTKSFDDDNFYPVGVLNDYLKGILNQFAENYGSIVNNLTSDITIYDVIKNNKVLYISLPVIASQEQKDILGKAIVAQIYSAYERLQNETLMEVPYSIFLDGHTYKYVSVDMLSQLRSKSLGFYFITQSLICEGIEANVENKIVLKIVDSNLIEKIIENNDTYNEQNKVFNLNDIMDLKLCKCFTKDKHNKFIKNDFHSVLDSSYIECKMMNLI